MTRLRTKTEITFEKRQRITLYLPRQRVLWCERRAAEVLMLTPEQAARLMHTTKGERYKCLQSLTLI